MHGRPGVWALLLGLAVFLVHTASPVVVSGDSRWNVFLALSAIHHGDLDLDEYAARVDASGQYAVQRPDGHIRALYPPGTVLLAVPEVAGLELTLHVLHPLLEPLARQTASPPRAALLRGDLERAALPVELLLASLWMAVAAVLVFRVGLAFTDPGPSLAVALVFAFASPAWSTGSRALGMQAADILLLSAAFLCAALAERRTAWWAAAGAVLSFGFYTRPTNAIPAAVFALWALWSGRRAFVWLVAGALPVAVVFTVRNLAVFGAVLEPYARPEGAPQGALRGPSEWGTALAGHLVSPARGLFVYAPILLAAAPGFLVWWRTPGRRAWAVAPAAICGLHYLLISSFSIWWGGYSNGPRLFADVLPAFVVLLVPFFGRWGRWPRAVRGLAMAAVVAGVLINGWTAWSPAPAAWNFVPNDVNQHTERIWDWADAPFLRGLGR